MYSYWYFDVLLLEEVCLNYLFLICDFKDVFNLRQVLLGSEKVVFNLCMKEMKFWLLEIENQGRKSYSWWLLFWGNFLYEVEFLYNIVLGCCFGKGKEVEEQVGQVEEVQRVQGYGRDDLFCREIVCIFLVFVVMEFDIDLMI